MNDRPIAITLFGAFISLSLAITWWAARRTHSRREFYSAGGELRGFQNGLAIAGDYTSAATFLGVTGFVYSSGFDGLIYAIGFLMACQSGAASLWNHPDGRPDLFSIWL
jgi:cation/acetate symporter